MSRRFRAIALGLGIGWALVVLVTLGSSGNPVDAWCYYGFDPSQPWDPNGCFLYSPPVAIAMIAIKNLMPFATFALLLRVAELLVLIRLAGPAVGLALFIPAVAIELNAANINLLIVAAVLIGFQHSAAWAFVALTKVTPGVGMLWFAARREWRHFAIAAGLTLAITIGSGVLAPDMWRQYFSALGSEPDSSIWLIWWRLPLAAIVVVWGARNDHRWALVVAVFLALPRWYFLSPVILIGLFPLVTLPRPLPSFRSFPAMLRLGHFPLARPFPATAGAQTVRGAGLLGRMRPRP
jgi:hypothetical protein